jgi:hypothetical protein
MGKKKGKIHLNFVNMHRDSHYVFLMYIYYFTMPCFFLKDRYCNSLIFMIVFCRLTSINEENY